MSDGPSAATLLASAQVLARSSRHDEARASYERVLAAARREGDRRTEAGAHNGLGLLLSRVADVDAALEHFERAVGLWREIGDLHWETMTLMNIATRSRRDASTTDALALLDGCLAKARASGSRTLEAHVLQNIGAMYTAVGAFDRAEEHVRAALAMYQGEGEQAAEATCLANLGGIANSRGEPAAAVELLSRSLAIRRELGDRHGVALALVNLGRAQARLSDLASAVRTLEEGTSILDEIGNPWISARAYVFLADACIEASDFDGATEALRRAVDRRRLTRDPDTDVQVMHSLALLAWRRGDVERALVLAEGTVAAVEAARDRLGGADARATYLALARVCYEMLVDLHLERHRLEPGAGHDVRGLEASERARARSLLELRSAGSASAGGGGRTAEEVRELLTAKLEERFRILSGDGTPADEARSRRELDLLASDLEREELRRKETHGGATEIDRALPLDLQGMRREVLDADTEIAAWAVGDERSHGWVVSMGEVRHASLPGRKELRRLVQAALAGCSRRDGDPSADLRSLAAAVLEPLGPFHAPRLVLVPDDVLLAAPFSALPDGPDGVPLLVSRELASLPSASVLPGLRRTSAARGTAPWSVAVVSDPVFDPCDGRLPGAVAPPSHLPVWQRDRDALVRLPFTRREAEAIMALAGASRVVHLTGFEARREAVLAPEVLRSRILHFATHGFMDASRPELSGLVLSLYDPSGQPHPGFLSAWEVAGLRLSADLVVLSGCRTALGREVRGEGVLGLARAFFVAGASRVLASLWRVDDVATAELMSRFYGALLGPEALPPAAALRRAALGLRADRRFAHPYFWASFMLQGDWR